jgi:hypothetical protein
MSDSNRLPYVHFGAQIGSWEAGYSVSLHLTVLAKLLRQYCDYEYVPNLDDMYVAFRVDGDIEHWDKEGCERLRLARKQRYITIDIMMPRSRWEGRMEIRRFITENFKNALQLMVNRLKKEKMEVDDTRLFEDYAKVEREYLEYVDTAGTQ